LRVSQAPYLECAFALDPHGEGGSQVVRLVRARGHLSWTVASEPEGPDAEGRFLPLRDRTAFPLRPDLLERVVSGLEGRRVAELRVDMPPLPPDELRRLSVSLARTLQGDPRICRSGAGLDPAQRHRLRMELQLGSVLLRGPLETLQRALTVFKPAGASLKLSAIRRARRVSPPQPISDGRPAPRPWTLAAPFTGFPDVIAAVAARRRLRLGVPIVRPGDPVIAGERAPVCGYLVEDGDGYSVQPALDPYPLGISVGEQVAPGRGQADVPSLLTPEQAAYLAQVDAVLHHLRRDVAQRSRELGPPLGGPHAQRRGRARPRVFPFVPPGSGSLVLDEVHALSMNDPGDPDGDEDDSDEDDASRASAQGGGGPALPFPWQPESGQGAG
jgi:hypothetical protein